jgi:HK97 family phage major capsid protein
VIGALKDAYKSNARFVTRREVTTKIRKFKDQNNNYLWQPSLQAGQPDMLAGYQITNAQDMPALANNSLSLAFGDFREAYQIVDRIGIRTLRDPYTGKPFVIFYSTKRVGGGVLNFEAIKFLKFS